MTNLAERRPITEEDGVHKEWYAAAKDQTPDTLPEFVRHLTQDYGHDYGTICHAVAAAALGAAWAVNASPVGGITGFQAGAVMWEFIMEWQGYRGKPLRLVTYEDALFPQYRDKFGTLTDSTWTWLQQEAAKRLAEFEAKPTLSGVDDDGKPWTTAAASPSVVAHWRSIVAGVVPFGLRVVDA